MHPCLAPVPFATLLLAASIVTTPLAGQEPEEAWQPVDTFGEAVSVEVVNVEVWVTDRQGRPVNGLGKEDFELREDGAPVEILYFSAFEGDSPARPEAAPGARAQGEVALPDEELLRVVVFVDDWNLRPEDRSRVLDELRDFLRRELRPGEEVMVMVHDGQSLSIAQELTADQETLGQSLDRVERRATPGIQARTARRQAYDEIVEAYRAVEAVNEAAPVAAVDPCVWGWPDMEMAFRSYAATETSLAQGSVSAIASALESLAGVPGSKVLLYVGNGLPDQAGIDMFELIRHLCPQASIETSSLNWSYDLTSLYQHVIERANAHGVTLYALEAESPAETPDFQPMDPRFRMPMHAVRLREGSLEATLSRMADETGGRAILNSADFGPAFAGIGQDLRHYYSLGFMPTHGGDGKVHRLEVRLKGQGGSRVRHRTAYLDKPPERRMVERVYGVASLASESNPLEVRLETGEPLIAPGGLVQLPLQIWVPLESITLIPEGGGFRGQIRVLMAVSGAGGAMGQVRQKLVPVEASEVASGQDRGEKLVEVTLHLPPGRHRVALAVQDELGGETSYLRHDLQAGGDQASRRP
ncbi:MAG TPA: VWA domain-containing protein [Thermoanaerobaculia bacterium]|nr:VWA domain-containing protein [Thermoanaerobaculia bacterium]